MENSLKVKYAHSLDNLHIEDLIAVANNIVLPAYEGVIVKQFVKRLEQYRLELSTMSDNLLKADKELHKLRMSILKDQSLKTEFNEHIRTDS